MNDLNKIRDALDTAVNKVRQKRKPKLRPVFIEFVRVDDELTYPDERTYTAVITKYKYPNAKRPVWRDKAFNQDYADGRLIGDFIRAETEAGHPVLDGQTLYNVMCEENDAGYVVWTSIERADKSKAS